MNEVGFLKRVNGFINVSYCGMYHAEGAESAEVTLGIAVKAAYITN